jgi:hypothetical protein
MERWRGFSWRWAPAAGSMLLCLLMLVAAWRTLPLDRGSGDVRYALAGNFYGSPGDGPVFILDEQWFPKQCGRGRLDRHAVLHLAPYANEQCLVTVDTLRPHLLPADFRVPWALVPEDEREHLNKLGSLAVDRLYRSFVQLTQTPFFRQDYVPRLRDALRRALQVAWDAGEVRQLLGEQLASLQPNPVDQLARDVLPIAAEHLRNHPWRSLRSALAILSGDIDAQQHRLISDLLNGLVSDPRVQRYSEDALLRFLTSEQMTRVAVAWVHAIGRVLMEDQLVQRLLLDLLADQRFLSMRPLAEDAQRWIKAFPAGLMRMRYSKDHNPLTTFVVRAQIRGQSRFLVLMLTPQQERHLISSLPPEPLLGRIGP